LAVLLFCTTAGAAWAVNMTFFTHHPPTNNIDATYTVCFHPAHATADATASAVLYTGTADPESICSPPQRQLLPQGLLQNRTWWWMDRCMDAYWPSPGFYV